MRGAMTPTSLNLKDLEKRYIKDVQFQSVVDSLTIYLRTSQLSPRDITAAAMLATNRFLQPISKEMKEQLKLPFHNDQPGPSGGE